MGKTLVVAEKSSVAGDIAKALGGFKQGKGCFEREDVMISYAVGHLVGLDVPEAKKTGNSLTTLPIIPEKFGLTPDDKKKSQLMVLSKLMKSSEIDLVVNACDAGREGEAIFRLIYEYVGCRKPSKRMWLKSMKAEAIRVGYEDMLPSSQFDRLAAAAKARSEADWTVGINASRGVSLLKEQEADRFEMMPIGRVQTPVLSMVVEREHEIANFIPKDYWEVVATFQVEAGEYTAKWVSKTEEGDDEQGQRIFDYEKAKALAEKCNVNPSSVTDSSELKSTEAAKLYDITTLQREANRKFKFSSKKTLGLAQSLYEKHKVISYPRSDAKALTEDSVDTVKEILSNLTRSAYKSLISPILQNEWIKPNKRYFNDDEVTDHYAIIPTGVISSSLTPDEQKIYDLVVRRLIAAFYPVSQHKLTKRTTIVSEEVFKCSGKVMVDPGWLVVYGSDDKSKVLCAVGENELPTTTNIGLDQLKTKPPSRYSEDTLLAAMENAGAKVEDTELKSILNKSNGIGTGATRAGIIDGLINRKYAYLNVDEKHKLHPNQKAMELIAFLKSNDIGFLTSPVMTAEWETKLKEIEDGSLDHHDFMTEINQLTLDMINSIKKKSAMLPQKAVKTLQSPCPQCSGTITVNRATLDCACGLKVYREIAQRIVTDAEWETLLTTGKVEGLKGFVSKRKKKFDAGLTFNKETGKVEFLFDEKEKQQSTGSLSCHCPNCSGVIQVYDSYYGCEQCDFKLWDTIAKRKLSISEAETLISTKSTPKLDGFTSKQNKKFSAALRLTKGNGSGKVEFDFN